MFSTCQLLVTLGQNLACATFLCTHTLRTLSAPFCWQGDVSVRRWQGCRLVGRHACRMPFAFPGACPFLHSAVIWHLHWQSARFLLSALPCIFILLGLCPWFVNRLFLGRRQIRQISAVLPEVATIRSLQLFFQSPHDFLVLDIPNPLSTRDGPYGCSKFYRLVNDGSELAKFWLRPGILQQVAIHDAAHMNHSDDPAAFVFACLPRCKLYHPLASFRFRVSILLSPVNIAKPMSPSLMVRERPVVIIVASLRKKTLAASPPAAPAHSSKSSRNGDRKLAQLREANNLKEQTP